MTVPTPVVTKPWYASKTVWLNAVATLVAIYSLLQVTPVFPTAYLPYLGLAVGVLNVVIRIWFTDTPIG